MRNVTAPVAPAGSPLSASVTAVPYGAGVGVAAAVNGAGA